MKGTPLVGTVGFLVSLLTVGPATPSAQSTSSGGDASFGDAPALHNPPRPALAYGMNASVNRWSQRCIAFADAMARALEFTLLVDGQSMPQLCPVIPLGEQPPRLGEGWPDTTQLDPGTKASARLFSGMAGTVPDGRVKPWVLTWEGSGSCSLSGPAVVGEAARTPQRVEVFVDPTAGDGDALLLWVIDSSSPSDPVRNAHVWLPGMEVEKPIFWPPFVEKLRAMNGGAGPDTWRALDWCAVNEYGNTEGAIPFDFDLAGRITPASPSQGHRRGVCPEFQVALCNELGSDLHFLVPHQADPISDEDYELFLRDQLLRIRDGSPAVPGVNGGQPFAGLHPSARLTLEYSNEIWNANFPVRNWLKVRAQANGLTFPQQAANEIARVFAIARDVFAGQDANRLRCYVGGTRADGTFLQDVLDGLPPGFRVDAVGPAGYFAPSPAQVQAWLQGATTELCPNCPSPVEVIDAARETIPILALQLREHRQIANTYANPDGSHPALELYEAGQSFVPGFQPWGPAAIQAQVLPEMYYAYVDELVPTFVAEGVDAVMWYSFLSDNQSYGGVAGPFGHWDNMDQTITLPVPDVYVDEGAPKAAAVYRGPPLH